jgi:glutamate/aspartate transport system substrate-binding protein
MIRKLIAATAVIAAVTAPAFSQDLTGTLAKVQETGQLVIGHRDSSLPFSYYDDQQNVVGYAMDISGWTSSTFSSSPSRPRPAFRS